jgi:hypothetical protein
MALQITREQKWLIGSTFGIGFVAGAYLYLTAFAPAFHDGLIPGESVRIDESELSIRGTEYGACIESGKTCPSFELTDGVLRSAPPTALAEDPVIVRIDLSRGVERQLSALLTEEALTRYQAARSSEACSDPTDTHYRYEIDRGGERVVLDTCRTAFPEESELAVLLASFFERGVSSE